MTTLINADTVLGGAIVTGDASGQLGLQAAGTTLMELSGSVVTVSGDASFEKSIVENVYTLSGTEIDPSNGTIQTKVLSAPVTFTESFSSGESVVLMIEKAQLTQFCGPLSLGSQVQGMLRLHLQKKTPLCFGKLAQHYTEHTSGATSNG